MQAAPQDELTLPGCFVRQRDGIFVDLSKVGGGFEGDIDRLLNAGARFCGLDYGLLTGLLYDNVVDQHDAASKLKLAADITAFLPERRALYKAFKMDAGKQSAEYIFEPVSMVVVSEDPVYGEPGADGVAPVVGLARKEELQPTMLDIDEFIADMWLKGVRFGIDVAAVSGGISRRETVRMVIASQRDATEGIDAEIEEACSVLHRDNSPKQLVSGKADLRKFQNRFPQIESGARLLKKRPRVPGKPGYKVSGEMILPRVPLDEINLQDMAGPGTCVEFQDGCEYILASQDGFLSLDVKSNNISVTEKIENKDGISIKTTGDLTLSGNDFIEHGEVQEGRVVEGKNMTFRSNVYGDLISRGGLILLEKNLSGGSAKSQGGDITSNGRVFNAVIEACTGQVTLKYAESSLMLGASVAIEHAVNCEIVADSVQVGSAEGCSIAGKQINIDSSSARREKETIVSMVVPDFSPFDAQVARIEKALAESNKTLDENGQELALIRSDAEFAKYLALAASIRQGKIQLSGAQQEGWKKMTARFAKNLSAMSQLNTQMQEQLKQAEELLQEKAYLLDERMKASAGISCEITEVTGDTLVRSMVAQIAILQKSSISEIKAILRDQDVRHLRVFYNDTGSLVWSFSTDQSEQKK